ncbi:MAG: IS5 family transposase [Christensenellales bacterium]
MKQIGLFDESNRLKKLSSLGDPLEKLNSVIDWRMFEGTLNKVFAKEQKGVGGRPPYSYLLMFKILILQRLFNISDDQAEYQINDRVSFMRFLGLSLGDRVPDAKTIWLFRDTLVKADVIEGLFKLFNLQLEQQGIISHKGTIVDATFVEAPRQRNTREENRQIKEGKTPEGWDNPENVSKVRQKDTDARWMTKNKERHFGYKDHVKVDADSKLITAYSVTDASIHDSQALIELIDEKDQVLYADSAYSGRPIADKLPQGIKNQIHEKGYRNRPLSEEQKAENKKKSRIRARIEHVFGYMTGSLHGITVRSIGIARAKFNIGLTNLIYNLCRYVILSRGMPTAG